MQKLEPGIYIATSTKSDEKYFLVVSSTLKVWMWKEAGNLHTSTVQNSVEVEDRWRIESITEPIMEVINGH